MELLPTQLPGVFIVRPQIRQDMRGSVLFVWNRDTWLAAGLPATFVLENHLISHQWVLRGIHRQMARPQGKLVRCLSGRVFDVAVDLRPDAATFGHWTGRELDSATGEALWIPPGFGHGMLALTEGAVLSIQASAPAVPGDERTLAWNDLTVGVEWPLPTGQAPVLSDRDRTGASLPSFHAEGA
jgi:dTDP-4-dehydrorhamnose 3,5-epimerase